MKKLLEESAGTANLVEHIFKIRTCFDQSVQRLEFEVEWKDPHPVVGKVKPGGQGELRGVRAADVIAGLAGLDTTGQGREVFLPKLRERPLELELHRRVPVEAARPHMALSINFLVSRDDLGMDIAWGGPLPLVSEVREGSPAALQGIFAGDAIHKVNGRPANMTANRVLQAAVQQRPLALELWRRPVNADPGAPWLSHLHKAPPSVHGTRSTTLASLAGA